MFQIVENGNIFEATTQSIVNPVNCVGVMGAGLALKFKAFYPEMFTYYKEQCDAGKVRPGVIVAWALDTWHSDDYAMHYIFNVPTKIHWRDPSTMSYIRLGVDALITTMKEHDVHSVAIPAIGCGLGGLQWDEVSRTIIEKFQRRAQDKAVFLYAPHGA